MVSKAASLGIILLVLLCGTPLRPAWAQERVASVRVAAPGWVTFGQVVPPGQARAGLRVGNLETQSDVKTRWPDGSIRFVILSARIPAAGSYTVTTGPVIGGDFVPVIPQVRVVLNVGALRYVADLPTTPTTDAWLSGPAVREWRAVVAPVSADSPHPFLRVVFDTRVYADGQHRVDVTVENTLNVKGATAVTYDAAVLTDRGPVLERKAMTHPWLTRWRTVLGMATSAMTHDFEPAYRASAIPRYLSVVENIDDAAAMSGPEWDPLGRGPLHNPMNDHGGRRELAPYPDWQARFIVWQEPRERTFVLRTADLAGSWPVHVREGNGRFVTIDAHPDFWLDSRGVGPLGDLSATGPLRPDIAHQPALAYLPYLMTGDRYYADEMAFWANYTLLGTYQDTFYNLRGGGHRKGFGSGTPVLPGSHGLLAPNETRGIGWGLRNLADAAAYLPDNDPLRAYFTAKVQNNLAWADELALRHVTPLGTYFENTNYVPVGQPVAVAPWPNNYLAWALDRAHRHGFSSGQRLRDGIARFQLGLFTAGADFPRIYAAPYFLTIGVHEGDGRIGYLRSLKEVFAATFGTPPTPPMQYAGYYGVDARLMLLIAVREGWPGAREALDYLEPHLSDLPRRAGWAIAPDRVEVPAR